MNKNDQKEVAIKQKGGAVANVNLEQFADQGFDNVDSKSLALPFLKILGQLSPEVNKRDGKYVEGAEPGMIYNSVSHQLFDGEKGINVIPCFYKLEYVEWKDRGEGGGAPVAIHAGTSPIINTRQGMSPDYFEIPSSVHPNKSGQNNPAIINHCLDSFGPDRVIFGGDWPVCRLVASYKQWVDALKAVVADRPYDEQLKLFHDNAERLYDI